MKEKKERERRNVGKDGMKGISQQERKGRGRKEGC